jgi:hypothetical protein
VKEEVKNTRPIFVICGVDSHLPRIKKCIESIVSVYGDTVDIALSTFGTHQLPPSGALQSFCEDENHQFFDAPRQKYPGQSMQCEIIGMFQISRHFQENYDEVYLLHNDLLVFRDFLPVYRCGMTGNWSFVIPLIRIRGGMMPDEYRSIQNSYIFGNSNLRMTQAVTIFNPSFINKVYETYESDDRLWNDLFMHKMWCGDVSLFDIKEGFLGYDCSILPEEILLERHFTFRYDGDFFEYIDKHEEIKYIHGENIWK